MKIWDFKFNDFSYSSHLLIITRFITYINYRFSITIIIQLYTLHLANCLLVQLPCSSFNYSL